MRHRLRHRQRDRRPRPCAVALLVALPAVLPVAAASLSGCAAFRRSKYRVYRPVARAGVRVGQVEFGGFELREMDAQPVLGLYYRLTKPGPFLWEAGVDASADPDDTADRQLYAARAALFFYPVRTKKGYLLAEAGALHEVLPETSYTAGFAGAGAGWGFHALDTELDLRVSYWKVVESENAQDALVVTVGYGF